METLRITNEVAQGLDLGSSRYQVKIYRCQYSRRWNIGYSVLWYLVFPTVIFGVVLSPLLFFEQRLMLGLWALSVLFSAGMALEQYRLMKRRSQVLSVASHSALEHLLHLYMEKIRDRKKERKYDISLNGRGQLGDSRVNMSIQYDRQGFRVIFEGVGDRAILVNWSDVISLASTDNSSMGANPVALVKIRGLEDEKLLIPWAEALNVALSTTAGTRGLLWQNQTSRENTPQEL